MQFQGRKLTLLKAYQKDNNLRDAFNTLAIDTFNLSFEDWYQSGYWQNHYIPYTLFDAHTAVANASVNIMPFRTPTQTLNAIQIGTVMTKPEYRQQGLSRYLLEAILNDWYSRADFIYLYANDSVLDFYPKFGFSKAKEQQFFKMQHPVQRPAGIEKLDMTNPDHLDLVYQRIQAHNAFSALQLVENTGLIMFYCLSLFKEDVYYLPEFDLIAIARFDDTQLFIYDIFGKTTVSLNDVISAFATASEVLLGFTPNNTTGFQSREINTLDETLFIQSGKTALFNGPPLMFPLLSHA